MSFSYLRAFRYTTGVLAGYQTEPAGTFDSRGTQAPYFLPPNRAKIQGTLLLTHGMAARGVTDPRILTVGSSLAREGYAVVIPHYPEIRDLVVDPVSIDQIESDIQMIAGNEMWGSPKKIGVISASFSASLSTVAACRESCRELIAGVFCIGPFGDVHKLLEFMFSAAKCDPYGFYIVMKNFLFPEGHPLRLAFDHAARDNGLQREPPHLPGYLASLSADLQNEFERAKTDSEYRLERWRELSVQPRATGMMKEVNAIDYLEGLGAPLLLLHGRQDDVIPANESVRLYRRCKELGKETDMVITDLISHGTPQIGLSVPLQIHRIVGLVARFFRYTEKA